MTECIQFDGDKCVEWSEYDFVYDIVNGENGEVQIQQPPQEVEKAPTFSNERMNPYNMKKYGILLVVFVVCFGYCWYCCKKNTEKVQKMKNGGDGKSSISSKAAGIGGGPVKKPPKEISVQIDADSEDADDVPPAPSAARALRFSRKQAEKMGEAFVEKVTRPFKKPQKGYEVVGSDTDSVAEEHSEANTDKYGSVSERFF